MSMKEMLVIASVGGAFGLWYWYCSRDERKRKADQAKLEMQRRVLGINPGPASYPPSRPFGYIAHKRCPRGVCTTAGASCPTECVQEPQVFRHRDGRRSHKYDNVEVCFGSDGNIRELSVDGKAWQ